MYIGKQDDDNNLTGSGINIDTYGELTIGQWKDGERAPGYCIVIHKNSLFRIGENYRGEYGGVKQKGFEYKLNGTDIPYFNWVTD